MTGQILSKSVFPVEIIPPIKGKPPGIYALTLSGFVVYCSHEEIWWPLKCEVGEVIIWQPNYSVKFRPVHDRHYEHLSKDDLDVIKIYCAEMESEDSVPYDTMTRSAMSSIMKGSK